MAALRFLLTALLLLLAMPVVRSSAATGTTPASQPPAETLTPAQAQQALSVLQDDAKRTQLLQVLRAVAIAAPAEKPPGPGQAAPGTHPTPAASEGLGTELVQALSAQSATVAEKISLAIATVANFPLLWDWLVNTLNDPSTRAQIIQTTWRLALVMVFGIAADLLVYRLRARPVRVLTSLADTHAAAPEDTTTNRHAHAMALLRRLPLAVACLALELLGPAAFAAVAYVALGSVAHDAVTRQLIAAVIGAYLLSRGIMCLVRLVLAPDTPSLRLLPLVDGDARQVEVWIRVLVLVATYGPALIGTAVLLGLYTEAADAMNKFVGLVMNLVLIGMVLRLRHVVGGFIAGHAAADAPVRTAFIATLRRRLARVWHLAASVLIFAAWVVWAFEVNHGFAQVLRLFVTTWIVVAVARVASILALGLVDRMFRVAPDLGFRFPGLENRAQRYAPTVRRAISVVIVVGSAIVLLQLWGIDVYDWLDRSRVGSSLLSALLSIATVIAVTWVLWEVANALLDGQVAHLQAQAQVARAARWRTLTPIIRTLLLAVMLVFLLLTILSEIGVNTAPLLAGASIFGVALGFGSQKLVQDFITGLFLLLENAMQVGDAVTVSGLSGSVENLSIRTIRLRAGDGSVHIIPFSSVTSVTNVNRGIGNAAVTVTVATNEDTDRVSAILKDIGAELRDDDTYGPMMRGELALWGVDKVDGTGVTLAGQIECTDSGRWGVQREFNRRMKMRLQEAGIKLAVPVQTLILQRERDRPVTPRTSADETAPAESKAETVSPPPQALGHDA